MKKYPGVSGFINFYLDTNDLSIEELKIELKEMGVKTENMTKHFDSIIKKEEAKIKVNYVEGGQKNIIE